MNSHLIAFRSVAVGLLCAFLTGCLFRPATVTTRQFVLTPTQELVQTGDYSQLAVGIGMIKLPDYLLRSSMAVRRGDNEIEYLENALWAERLDHSFQHTLAANLTRQFPGSRIRLSAWQKGEVTLAAFVSVERLDVDQQGAGTLTARWQIESPDRRKILKSGQCSLNRSGPSPELNPGAIAATLSELTAQFGGVLGKAIQDCASTGAEER